MENQPKDDKTKKIEGEYGGTHSYSMEEVYSFAEHVNFFLKDEPLMKDYLPVDSDSEQFFDIVGDGIVLCKMVNAACPGTIQDRAINTKKPLNIFKINENLNLAISSAKSIGCKLENIHPELIIEKRVNIILGLTWQIVKIHLFQNITLQNHPYLVRLKKDDEELDDLLKLPKEELLMRWFNYHLAASGSSRKVTNFGADLKDGQNYVNLLHQLNSSLCNKESGLKAEGTERAKIIISHSAKLGVPKCIKPSEITNGITKLNLLFTAHIFNNCPGLTPNEQDKQLIESAGIIDDDKDVEAGQESRTYRMWINSMGLEDVYVANIPNDLNDGIVLLKAIDKIFPGQVEWSKCKNALKNLKSKLNKVQICNYVIDLCKALGVHITGIGGVDIVDGKKSLVFSILFQVMKANVNQLTGGITEDKLIEWMNSQVDKEHNIANFKDPKQKDGIVYLQLLDSVSNGLINWELVQKGDTDEELENNAKYVISAARKFGATVFCIWEHIRKCNSKFLFTLVASIRHASEKK